MPFPSQVNVVPALGVAGDFCDTNPRVSVVNQQGAFVAGPFGTTVGLFAWADAANRGVSNSGVGAPTGFVARALQAIITDFLGEATQRIVVGLPVVLYSAGGFFVKNDGANVVTIGMKAYADNSTGKVTFAATGSPIVGGTSTASTIAAATSTTSTIAANSFTASSFAGNVFTLGTVTTGVAFVGQTLSGTNVVPGTTIVAQLSGTANGAGTYQTNIVQNVATPGTVTGSGGLLTVAGTVTGFYAVGETLTGSGITTTSQILAQLSGTAGIAGTYAVSVPQTISSQAIGATGGLLTIGGTLTGVFAANDLLAVGASAGTYIKRAISGTGGAGTYLVNNSQTVASTAINVNSNTETKFAALSTAAAGELVKMSSHVLG